MQRQKYMCYLFMHQLISLIIVTGHAIYDVDFPQKVSTTWSIFEEKTIVTNSSLELVTFCLGEKGEDC